MFLLTNCRTGDDGTNNHGKATEGIKDRMQGDKGDTNSMETNDVPAGDTSDIQM